MRPKENVPKTDYPESEEDNTKQPFFATASGKIISGLLMLVLVALMFTYTFTSRGSKGVTVGLDDHQIGIACTDEVPVFIDYEQISRAALTDSFQTTKVISVSDWDDGLAGIYENEEWGRFYVYAYSAPGEYIILETDYGTVVVNQRDKKETEKLYKDIVKHL